jgi:hypothetical protein
MLKITMVIGMLLAAVAPAHATVMYTFTGNDSAGTPTLAGTLFLDDGTPFVVFSFDYGGQIGTLLSATLPPSPLSTIAGTFTGVAFTGTATLDINNFPIATDTSAGFWIVRTDITSADASLVHLSLIVNSNPGIVPISLTPPTPCCFNNPFIDSQYAIGFADRSFTGGALSLTVVPEPPTGLLLVLACTLLAFLMRSHFGSKPVAPRRT